MSYRRIQNLNRKDYDNICSERNPLWFSVLSLIALLFDSEEMSFLYYQKHDSWHYDISEDLIVLVS